MIFKVTVVLILHLLSIEKELDCELAKGKEQTRTGTITQTSITHCISIFLITRKQVDQNFDKLTLRWRRKAKIFLLTKTFILILVISYAGGVCVVW